MANENSGLSDDVQASTFGDADPAASEAARQATDQPDPIPDRPADGATKAKWVDYCVALGADRTFLISDTEHFDAEAGEPVTEPALTRDDLIDLADRLGG